ncbi:hypothetical protein [Amycolatopsis taiwanensis]|uniref:hypothetical protein n=1 Tax=Amycolatopsis taiwanensis TaxID=342230 RepID=UPI000482656F|nr:hypothetical protein [Amycolatopsis taiwanensis]
MATSNDVSKDLLADFDNLLADSAAMPIDELKARFQELGESWLIYNDHRVFDRVLSLPVTIDMILGDQSDAVRKIVAGLKEIHGDELEFVLDGSRSKPELVVRKWRDEDALRKAWKEHAEDQYRAKNLGGGR